MEENILQIYLIINQLGTLLASITFSQIFLHSLHYINAIIKAFPFKNVVEQLFASFYFTGFPEI